MSMADYTGEHPHTLAKLAALQARCDRLEDALCAALLSASMMPNSPWTHDNVLALIEIIKGD